MSKFKKICIVLGISLSVILAGYLLMVPSYLIPNKWIYGNVYESAEILMNQYTSPIEYLDGWFLDNYTDADCISVAYSKASNNPFYSAFDGFQRGASVDGLKDIVNGNISKPPSHRYLWHGYRIWLRPLLAKYNITEIRCLCYYIIILLSVIMCMELIRKTNSRFAFLPFLSAFGFFNFFMESLSLLFFNDFAVSLLASLFIIYTYSKEKIRKYYEEVFVGIGSIQAFSSMLIMPILTIGFPLVTWLFLDRDNKSWKKKTITTLKYSICWFVGYTTTMLTKIILLVVVDNSNSGFNQIRSYTGIADQYTLKDRFQRIFDTFKVVMGRSKATSDIAVIAVVILLIYIVIRKRTNLKQIYKFVPYFIVALYPCAWCFIIVGHTVHRWTCFNFSISIYALLCVLFNLCGVEKKKDSIC